MEKNHPVSELMAETIEKIKEAVDANTVVGEPIVAGEITLIPVSKISLGFGTGGSEMGGKTPKVMGENPFGGGGGAVAVAVRLDHRHGLAAGGQGGLYRLKIPLQTVQVNLRPGAFQEFGHEKPAAFRVFFRSIAHACCVYAIHYTLFFAINQTFSLGFRLCPSFPILRGEGDGISCFYLFPFRGIYGNIKSIHGQGGAPALYRMK